MIKIKTLESTEYLGLVIKLGWCVGHGCCAEVRDPEGHSVR